MPKIKNLNSFNQKKEAIFSDSLFLVLKVGIEPTLPKELDFESKSFALTQTHIHQ